MQINVLQTLRNSFELLSKRDRRLLLGATGVQTALSLLDIVGVLLIGGVAALSVSSLTGRQVPSSVGRVAESVGLTSASPGQLAIEIGAAAAVVLILKSVLSVYLNRRILRFLARRQAIVSGQLIAGFLSRPLMEIQNRSSQETAYALTYGVNAAILVVLGQGSVAVSEIALLLAMTGGLFLVSPGVTLFALVFFSVVAVVTHQALSGWAGRVGRQSSLLDVASLEAIQESLNAYRELTVSGRRNAYAERVQKLRWSSASVTADIQFIGLAPKYIFEVALVVGAALLAASQFVSSDAAAAVGVIAVFLAAASRVLPSLLRMQGALISVKSAGNIARPTFDLARVLSSKPVHTDVSKEGVKGTPLSFVHEGFNAHITAKHLSVTYAGALTPTLNDISFQILPGQSIALVGSTGAGKSTLADVLLGVLQADEGDVFISGVPPLNAIERWPGSIAYVPQSVGLVNGSIRANVALGLEDHEIDDDLVWESLARAHIGEYLRQSRQGLDTVIGEKGIKLSGGQRQRLGIARALFSRPKLLVLDEATSALDAETEMGITQTLKDLEGDVTTVTIAHRLAIIRFCDLILYMESGRILARGNFSEVCERSVAFRRQADLLGMK